MKRTKNEQMKKQKKKQNIRGTRGRELIVCMLENSQTLHNKIKLAFNNQQNLCTIY